MGQSAAYTRQGINTVIYSPQGTLEIYCLYADDVHFRRASRILQIGNRSFSIVFAMSDLSATRPRKMLANLLALLMSQLVLADPVGPWVAVSSTSTAQPIGFAAYVSLSIELVSFPLFAGV